MTVDASPNSPTDSPTAGPTNSPTASGHSKARRRIVLALQTLGFLIGLGLLVWVISKALQGMTPDDWDRLQNASFLQLAGLIGLGTFSVGLNGVMWWLAIRPVRRVPFADVAAVNALATLLAYAPFKLSMLFRATWHRAVDGVPVLTFGGWAATISATVVAGLAPAVALRLTPLQHNDTLWFAGSIAGAIAAAVLGSLLARTLATGAGWRAFRRAAFRLRGRAGLRVVRSDLFTNLHAAMHMLGSTRTVVAGAMLRLIDGCGVGARFLIAAAILGAELDAGTAMVVGVSFFVIGAVAPTGVAGVREGGTAGVFALLGVTDAVAPVVVFVAATQILGELAVGGIAAAWLGPRKLARLGRTTNAPAGRPANPKA